MTEHTSDDHCPCCGAEEADWNGANADENYSWSGSTNSGLRARVAALEAHNKRMWDFIVSLDGMNCGHMHDGAIDDEIAIVASDFKE